jgi:PilZ domain
MVEHRRAPRLRAEATIQVVNSITGEAAGRIANLSIDGMMLVTDRPARDDALYQFTFQLPDQRGQLRQLEIGMHEQWSEEAGVPGQHWVGLRFIDISPEDHALLQAWLERGRAHWE